MDDQLVWREEYNIGVDIIDKEHQRLFQILSRLLAFGEEEKKNQRACQEGIKYFKGFAMRHFTDEEAYMESIRYKGLERHKYIHKSFREKTLPALEQELEQTGYSPEAIDHFLGVCTGWLIGHTIIEDQAIAGKRDSTWEALLPSDAMEALVKVIVHLVFDLFHLESQMVTDTYSGEKFGKGIYYWMSYGSPQGDGPQQEVIMAFEEKLLITTVGKVMGIKTNKLDSMLVHAARYSARQFVKGVMEHLPGTEQYELKEESLLTYGQFQEIFQREKPQASLLFNTGGSGYFAYCAIAPHMLQHGVGTPIVNENAMKEVEKYLSRRDRQAAREEAAHRLKVLVVDDSATIRQGMKQLLGSDYQVETVDSGASAFRAISLDRPDLVLLDYEMPVCDGRQTLEMLRSVEDFKDIPVIFLSGRRDTDSILKIMPLNPAGYLLKDLKPEEIKRKIKSFLETGKL